MVRMVRDDGNDGNDRLHIAQALGLVAERGEGRLPLRVLVPAVVLRVVDHRCLARGP